MLDLLIATTNPGKFTEIQEALKDLPLRLISLRDLPNPPDVPENGGTFEVNARLKARTYARWSGQATLADDSGLVVEALGGRPGIHSARYAGEGATDEDNRQKLLKELEGIPEGKRGAAFVCCLVLATPEDREVVIEGRVEGVIALAPRGQNGFGYDPLFLIPSLNKTLAELPLTEKNRISHRGKALARLKETLMSFFGT